MTVAVAVLALLAGFLLGLACRLRPFIRGVMAGQRQSEVAHNWPVENFPASVALIARVLVLNRPPDYSLVDRNIQHTREAPERPRTKH